MMACGNCSQLFDKIFTLLGSLLRNTLFKSYINSSDGSSTSERITACGGGMNKRIAVHDTPYFRSGHEGAYGHYTATKAFADVMISGVTSQCSTPHNLPVRPIPV